jgi:acetone carboxylase gamma subunit
VLEGEDQVGLDLMCRFKVTFFLPVSKFWSVFHVHNNKQISVTCGHTLCDVEQCDLFMFHV